MVGAGIFPKEKSEREEASVIPKGTLVKKIFILFKLILILLFSG